MGEWLDSTAPWPSHSRDWWDLAITKARDAGWYLRAFDGHSWGRVACSVDPNTDSPCSILVFSTGKGSENVARQLEKMVDRCKHRPRPSKQPTGPERALMQAASHADNAERLIEAAVQCAEADRLTQRAQELLSLALDQIEQGEGELAAEELSEEAGQVEAESARLKESSRDDDGNLRTVEELAAAAGSAVDAGTSALRRAKAGHPRTRALRARLERLRARVTGIQNP